MNTKYFFNKISEEEYIKTIMDKFVKPLNFTNSEMFPGDWNRYREEILMLDKIDLQLNEYSNVLDLGSPIPFMTYSLALKYNCNIICKDIGIKIPYYIDKVSGELFNVCKDNLGLQKWDLISFTDVLEHLPCNLYLVREKVISSLRDNRYLLISYPMGNTIIAPYGCDMMNQDWDITHTHMREFPNNNAINFIPNLKIIAKRKVYPPSYKSGSIQILYKKEFTK